MKDSDWEILYELYQSPNLTHVANRLYMTQPSLTKRLQHMEDEFGVSIVNRTSKGLEFTEEGKFLVQQAGDYLEFLDAIRSHLKTMKAGIKQEIVVAASYTFSKAQLPDLLLRYAHHHPDVHFTVVVDPSNVLFRKVIEGDADIAIVRGDYSGPVEQVCLSSDLGYRVTWKPVTEDELHTMQRISYKCNDKTQELLQNWWKDTYHEEMPEGMNVGYTDVALQLVYKGLGYTLCFLPRDFDNANDLCLTPLQNPDGAPLVRRTWLVRSGKARPAGPAVEDFAAFIEREMKKTTEL